MKNQKDRPEAAEITSTNPFLPHLFFRCRIMGGISADFFGTLAPQRRVVDEERSLGLETLEQVKHLCSSFNGLTKTIEHRTASDRDKVETGTVNTKIK